MHMLAWPRLCFYRSFLDRTLTAIGVFFIVDFARLESGRRLGDAGEEHPAWVAGKGGM
jgi:hypothetical protein